MIEHTPSAQIAILAAKLADRQRQVNALSDLVQLLTNQCLAAELRATDAEKAPAVQRKAWLGVVRIELDGPIVDYAEAQVRRIDAALRPETAEAPPPVESR